MEKERNEICVQSKRCEDKLQRKSHCSQSMIHCFILLKALGRDLVKVAFGVKRIYAVFAKDGAGKDSIQAFEGGISSGPSLTNARIDKYGDINLLRKSAWNRQLLALFAQAAQEIASQFSDGRFGTKHFDWDQLFKERIYHIFRDEINGRAKPGEGHNERVFRLAIEHDQLNSKNNKTTIRHLVSIAHFLFFLHALIPPDRNEGRGPIQQLL